MILNSNHRMMKNSSEYSTEGLDFVGNADENDMVFGSGGAGA